MSNSLTAFCRRIGHTFGDPTLLELAMTHRSYGGRNNERLEFLGDSIVNFVIAEALFQRFPPGAGRAALAFARPLGQGPNPSGAGPRNGLWRVLEAGVGRNEERRPSP